jgi:ABC-type multidrug transport system fused ATPase/permease subunit
MFAYDYPLLGFFWTVFILMLWIWWLFLLFRIIFDIFRRHDIGGWGKAGWLILTLLIPFLGVLIYVIVNGHGMAERAMADAQQADQATQAYIRQAAGSSASSADELSKLAALKDQGVITDAEFAAQKAKILA